MNYLDIVKKLTISALVSDDLLMGILVLKGGNALQLAYEITNRGSIDIDFSMERDFTTTEKKRIENQIKSLLEIEFAKEKLHVFDINFSDRPDKIPDELKSFWGGYMLEFKVINLNYYLEHQGDIDNIRRNAIPLHKNHSPKFTVDFSKYEFIKDKVAKDIEGTTVYVYTPEMLAIEKLRALCQQIPEYKDIVYSMHSRPRARDFFDIYNLTSTFNIDFSTKENIELLEHIFAAKKVPVGFIKLLNDNRDYHRSAWDSVTDTVDIGIDLNDFDFYFDYVINSFNHFL